ncbi:pilus assembly protein TadG-related protein [Streptomyces sp. T-3]|nr:pilus assembly protein TadG-related protein [Streptomyces sp. T-3]
MNLNSSIADRVRNAQGDDRGQATAFVVVILMGLWLFAGIVVDGGLALAAKVQALDTAQEAARTGAQHIDLEQLRSGNEVHLLAGPAETAARDYVAATGATGSVTVRGNEVAVRVMRHQRTQILQLIGVTTLDVAAQATVRAERAEPAAQGA